MVEVFTHTYNEIFKHYKNISVPEYQRPYRWTTEKVDKLLMDLEEFFITKPNPNLEYYMGGILFFQDTKEKKSQIIDGQQRLTTLTLIQYVLEGELQSNQNLAFNNHISFYNIKKNLSYLEEKRPLLDKLNNLKFFNRLRFTLILSDNEDNAFAFFDSQNNRGVTLGADDFLKAYHLREVHSEHLASIHIARCITIYNYKRRHSSLNWQIPNEVHQQQGPQIRRWKNYYQPFKKKEVVMQDP